MSTEQGAAVEVADEVVDAKSPSLEITVADEAMAKFVADLKELHRQAHNVVFDLATVKGDKAARQLRHQLVKARTSIERVRTEENRKDRESIATRIQQRDLGAAALTKVVTDLEGPLDAQIVADEDRRAAEKKARDDAEKARADALRQRIADIISVAVRAAGRPSAEIQEKLELVTRLEVGADFEEMQPAAVNAKAETILKLQELLKSAHQAEAAAAEAARNKAELERLQAAERDRLAAEERRRKDELAAREREQAAERERLAQQRRDQEAREESARVQQRLLTLTLDQIGVIKRNAVRCTAEQIGDSIKAIAAIATPADLGDMSGLVDKARDDALDELTELAERRAAEEAAAAQRAREAAAERERVQHNEMLMSEIAGIRQQLAIAQVGRVPHYKGGNVEDVEKILVETEAWPIDETHFGALFHSAEAVKSSTIQGLKQYLEQLRNMPPPLPADQVRAAAGDLQRKYAEHVQGGGSEPAAAAPAVEPAVPTESVAASGPDEAPISFTDHAMRLVSEVANVAKAACRTKASAAKNGPFLVPEADFRAMCEALTRVPLPGGVYYAGDGTLMNADGTRSVFDDVDQ